MNRNRKSVSKTPVQKTNLFHFFQRTPSSAVHNQVSSTPLADASVSTQSSSALNASTPFITRGRPPTECPACNKIVPFYKLNHHLDNDCVPNSPSSSSPKVSQRTTRLIDLTVPEIVLNSPPSTTAKEEVITELNTPSSNFILNTTSTPSKREKPNASSSTVVFHTPPPTPHIQKERRKFNSSSKKNFARRREIARQFKDRQVETDYKKHSENKLDKHEDWSSVKKKLFTEESKPKFEGLPYYLETFLFLLKSTFDEPLNQHLFNEEDKDTYTNFKSLSLEAQKLYARLFARKFQWRRKEKIDYKDIASDLGPALKELCSSSLLHGIDQLEDLPTLLKLLTQLELKQLFKDAKIPFNGKGNATEV